MSITRRLLGKAALGLAGAALLMQGTALAAERPAPFDKPGVNKIGENEYEVVMTLESFVFTPADIEIPAGSTVHFILTSKDVTHGFEVAGTNVNAMVMPGYIQKITQKFGEAGEYLVVCNEYCGAGHQYMSTTIRVV